MLREIDGGFWGFIAHILIFMGIRTDAHFYLQEYFNSESTL